VRDDSVCVEGDVVSKRASITVLPSSEHPDYLTVHDAMLQIADVFALLKGESGDDVDWRLVSATTNSPFTAVGEIISKANAPGVVMALAELKAEEAYQALTDVLAGDEPSGDIDAAILKRVLARNLNGVGLTNIEFDDRPPLSITPTAASAGLEAYKSPGLQPAPKRVRGSLEGELVDAGTFKRQPALKLKERAHGRIFWCRIPEERKAEFAEATSLDDVWRNARVRLRGWIEYSKRGEISGMSAEAIQHVRFRDVHMRELRDPDFTDGLDAVTYVDRLRDGDLG
jgi:hypothetical protein